MMNIVKKRFISLILGIILLVVALLMNNLNLVRAILCILSIVILTYSFQLERQNKKVFIPVFVLLFTLFVVALDYLVVGAFKKVPILSYSVVTSKYGTVYNAVGYRVWKCKDDTFKLDPLYKLGYYCQKESLTSENINNVLSTVINNFDDYKDSYVKVIGRVSAVENDTSFYMQMFKEEDGIIKFDNTSKMHVEFNYGTSSVSKLTPNSIVTVIGKIDHKSGNDIYMVDSDFTTESISSGDVLFGAEENIYCEYDKQLWFQTSDNIFYKSCIEDVNLKINGNQYNLQNAIKNNLISLEEIENEANGFQEQTKDKSLLFVYNDFKMMVCDPNVSKDIIIGRTTMDFSDGYCKVSNDNRGV